MILRRLAVGAAMVNGGLALVLGWDAITAAAKGELGKVFINGIAALANGIAFEVARRGYHRAPMRVLGPADHTVHQGARTPADVPVRRAIAEAVDVLVHPECWFQDEGSAYCPAWEAELAACLELGRPFEPLEVVAGWTVPQVARLGAYVVWVANHPYASFRPLPAPPGMITRRLCRPRRATILRAGRALAAQARAQLLWGPHVHTPTDAGDRPARVQ